jgi:hypothetical protein
VVVVAAGPAAGGVGRRSDRALRNDDDDAAEAARSECGRESDGCGVLLWPLVEAVVVVVVVVEGTAGEGRTCVSLSVSSSA